MKKINKIIHRIDLNLSQPNNFQYIHTIQGDNKAEIVHAKLYDKNLVYDASRCSSKVLIKGYTKSGYAVLGSTGSLGNPVLDPATGIVTFELVRELFCCAGENKIFLELYDKEDESIVKSTFPFVIYVIADSSASISAPQLTVITDYVKRSEKAAEASEKYYNQLISQKGQPNGVAELDANGDVPRAQLPDDLIYVKISGSNAEPGNQPAGDLWIMEM